MKFITALAFATAAAVAAPIAEPAPAAVDVDVRGLLTDVENDVEGVASSAKSAIQTAGQSQFGANCDVTGCAAALGPAAAGCGGAAAQAFIDPLSDAACLATALNDLANKPSECAQCSV